VTDITQRTADRCIGNHEVIVVVVFLIRSCRPSMFLFLVLFPFYYYFYFYYYYYYYYLFYSNENFYYEFEIIMSQYLSLSEFPSVSVAAADVLSLLLPPELVAPE
jgi:hypothetical protein